MPYFLGDVATSSGIKPKRGAQDQMAVGGVGGRSVRLLRQSPENPKEGAETGSENQKSVKDATLGTQNQCASPFASMAHHRAFRGAAFQSMSGMTVIQRKPPALSLSQVFQQNVTGPSCINSFSTNGLVCSMTACASAASTFFITTSINCREESLGLKSHFCTATTKCIISYRRTSFAEAFVARRITPKIPHIFLMYHLDRSTEPHYSTSNPDELNFVSWNSLRTV